MTFVVPAFAFAANTGGVNNDAARVTFMKTKADQEITRRIDSLNTLTTRVGEMKRLSEQDKASITSLAGGNVTDLNTLKTKIDADTDLETLKTDRQSITKSYRVYMLVIPKGHILAAADRILETTTLMNTVVTKLEARIGTAQTGGKDVAQLSTSLTDMKAKIADAVTQANNAKTAVTSLVPDQGVQTQIDSNKTALNSARTMIKNGITDLKTARTDAETIRVNLKAMGF